VKKKRVGDEFIFDVRARTVRNSRLDPAAMQRPLIGGYSMRRWL